MPFAAAALAALLASAVSATNVADTVGHAAPTVSVDMDKGGPMYSVSVDGKPWFRSPGAPVVCVAGKQTKLELASTKPASGVDKMGAFTGTTASFGGAQGAAVEYTFKTYAAKPGVAVAMARYPREIDTKGCGTNAQLSTHFPAFSTTAAEAAELHMLSWRGNVMSTTAAAKGLKNLGANGLDAGPVAATDPQTGNTLMWSTLDNHKIFPQTTVNGTYSMGLAAAIPCAFLMHFSGSTSAHLLSHASSSFQV